MTNSSPPAPVRGDHHHPPRQGGPVVEPTDRVETDAPTTPVVRPTFTVCIVVRDRATLLVNAVRSVLANTYQDFELVIVDDGSQIPVGRVIAEAGLATDRRIRVVSQPPTGIAEARNRGLRAAVGRYLTVLDSDDELTEDALARLHQLLTTTGRRWAYADYTEINQGTHRAIRLPEYASAERMLLGVLTRPRLPFKHSGTTIDRQVLHTIGGYDETFRLFEDIELVLRALRSGVQPCHLDHPIVRFQRHDGNVTRGRLGGLVFWFRLIDMYRPWRVPGVGLGMKALRTLSETGKWVVTRIR